jgi:hypothetical protein
MARSGQALAPEAEEEAEADAPPHLSLRQLAELPQGAAPCTESVATHVAYKVYYRGRLLCAEPGRLFFQGRSRNMDQRIQDMLQPVFSNINRDDHSERAALLHVTRAVLNRCGWHGSDDCDGWLRMYISHFPCISCIAVICQFVRIFPAIRLELDFDNMWKTRFEPVDQHGAERFHAHGGNEGRRERVQQGFYDW